MSEALSKLRARVDTQLRAHLLRSGLEWQGEVTRRFGHGGLTSRSGRLAGSVASRLSGSTIADFELRCTSAGVPYARAQEFGANIQARKGKYLTIPLSAMKTAGGVARSGFREWLTMAKATGRVIWARKGDGWVVLWAPTKDAAAQAFWKLQPRVTLKGPTTTGDPSKLAFFDTWRSLSPKREARFRKLLGAPAIFAGKT